MEERKYWRLCATCKKEIAYGAIYQTCSVSTCKKWAYCSVDCWDEHNPVMGHKSAFAEEAVAPDNAEEAAISPRRILVRSPAVEEDKTELIPKDILVVASKLKAYVKAKHDLNTSANVMEALSDLIRWQTDKAVEHAKSEGRKTLMDRDFV